MRYSANIHYFFRRESCSAEVCYALKNIVRLCERSSSYRVVGAELRSGANTVHTATVTGCLAQGDEPTEYAIKTESGKIYALSSSTVDLAKHMNHRVTVTGAATANNEKNSTTSIGQPEEDFLMKVTNLKMVSTTCQ
jgi:hypothetical protein